MNFNERLKEIRQEKGVTQKVVAKSIGVTTTAYTNYETGYREPSFQILKALCRYYKVSADYLLGLED